jgi:hypothetical protein
MLADRMRMCSGKKPPDEYTMSLLHMNGADETSIFTDETGRIWTTYYEPHSKIDTAQYKFGGASARLTNRIETDDIADFQFGNQDFTIDFWFKLPNLTSDHYLFEHSTTLYMLVDYSNSNKIACPFKASTGMVSTLTSSIGITDLLWHHAAIVRDTNYLYLFIDGVARDTADITGRTEFAEVSPFYIGRSFGGWIDEFRISKGIARWTANFTPPTQEY